MVHKVPPSKASIKQNRFEFQLPGSKKLWSLPKVRYIRADLLMEMQEITGKLRPVIQSGGKPTEEEAMALSAVQHKILAHYCPGLYSEIELEQAGDIIKAWGKASNPNGEDVDLGESSPSA